MNNPCLIFVYNADSSFFSMVKDAVHKTVSPKTYQCKLCGLTYGSISMKNEWKEFVSRLPCKAHFLHKDEFLKQYPSFTKTPLPAVFAIQDQNVMELIPSSLINQQNTLEELKQLVHSKIQAVKFPM